MTVIRVSQGVGSNPKLWAVMLGRAAHQSGQVGEFDISDQPGTLNEAGWSGMTGIVWYRNASRRPVVTAPSGQRVPVPTTARKCYGSVDEWVADVATEYPDAEIVRADDEPLKF